MRAKAKSTAKPARKGHAKSRALPKPVDAPLPPFLSRLMNDAAMGTLAAPIGASLPAIYLAAARALIERAKAIELAAHA